MTEVFHQNVEEKDKVDSIRDHSDEENEIKIIVKK